MDEFVFTTPALLSFLGQIDELSKYEINLTEESNEQIQVAIGDSIYRINANSAESVPIDTTALQEVTDIADDACEELTSYDLDYDSGLRPIETGVLKEAVKTLFVGGLVRLTNKILKK